MRAKTGPDTTVQEETFSRAIKYAMNNRLLNEEARLRSEIKDDNALDVWRRLYEQPRHALLFADRGQLLEMYERLFLVFLPTFLQESLVGPNGNVEGHLSETLFRSQRCRGIVDPKKHPRTWNLDALDFQLHKLVNTSLDEAGKTSNDPCLQFQMPPCRGSAKRLSS
jgi:hypothetical protein